MQTKPTQAGTQEKQESNEGNFLLTLNKQALTVE